MDYKGKSGLPHTVGTLDFIHLLLASIVLLLARQTISIFTTKSFTVRIPRHSRPTCRTLSIAYPICQTFAVSRSRPRTVAACMQSSTLISSI
ncbi:hypothetical protein F4803DRAFT_537332 [Xylaria telfairii]|nr:hypothetical protein F4803DRAFT_537332 [Xylaria telfairii]